MPQDEAKVRATRAAKQARHAAKNGVASAEAAAEAVTPDAEQVRSTANTVSGITSELGLGFLSLSVAVTAATYSFKKFQKAWALKP